MKEFGILSEDVLPAASLSVNEQQAIARSLLTCGCKQAESVVCLVVEHLICIVLIETDSQYWPFLIAPHVQSADGAVAHTYDNMLWCCA